MHTKSSIHIAPVKENSDAHNLRTGKPLDYVKKERTPLNTSEVKETIFEAKKRVTETYQKNVGQKMQAKATPIREGVVNLGKTQSLETLKNLADKLEDRFKIKTIQIHIHEDEGHHKVKSGDWKQNRHAHMVFDWTDEKGKSLKLNKADMAEMQSIVADTLGMERGQSSDKKHLNSMAYKVQEMKKDAVQMEKDLKAIKAAIKAQKIGENIGKTTLRGIKAIVGKDDASLYKKELETLKKDYSLIQNSYSYKMDQIAQLEKQLKKNQVESQENSKGKHSLVVEKAQLEQENRALQKEIAAQKEKLTLHEKNSNTAQQNEKIWKENFRKVVTGESSIEAAKEFLNKNSRNYGQKR